MPQLIDYKRYAILFVDDEEKSLKYFSRIFSDNFDVITTHQVKKAIDILQKKHEELGIIVVDQRMPEQKGVEILKYVKNNYPSIVRILTTAYSDIDDAIEAVNDGEIYRYITKPWNIDALSEQLKNAMHMFLAQQHERDILVEKQKIMFQLAGNIAHELRTPLLSIHSAAKGTNRYLPEVLETYRHAISLKNVDSPIPDKHLKVVDTALDDIVSETRQALTMIDMLLTNIGGEHIYSDETESYSVKDCLNEALRRYPLREEQRALVKIQGKEDFFINGSKLLLTHVFFNLLKNAIYAINAKNSAGKITIKATAGTKDNKLSFKDTGIGIPPNILPHIFENFYSTKSSSAGGSIGIGLPFCKRVLEHFNSKIECRSEEGKFTEFILTFPICKSPVMNADIISFN